MRTCIVFRGENLRYKRGLTSALECLDNWKETILDVIPCDVAFFTYPSEILDELIEKMSPVHVCTSGYDSQDTNVLAAVNWMIEHRGNYDRFVLLRFDFMYRKRITDWPHWDKNGVTLTSKDHHYPTFKFYHDMVFVVDREWVGRFRDAFVADGKLRICLHHIGKYLEEMPDVPFHLMFPDYYYQIPILATHPVEPRPNLDEDYQYQIIHDVSPWNPGLAAPPQKMTKPRLPTRPTKPQPNNNIHKAHTRPIVIFSRKK